VPSIKLVKFMKNGLVPDVLTCTCPVVLNKNNEIVSIAKLSGVVMFAGMKFCERNDALSGVGSTSCIAGKEDSATVNVVNWVTLNRETLFTKLNIVQTLPRQPSKLPSSSKSTLGIGLINDTLKNVIFAEVFRAGANTLSTNAFLSVKFVTALTLLKPLKKTSIQSICVIFLFCNPKLKPAG